MMWPQKQGKRIYFMDCNASPQPSPQGEGASFIAMWVLFKIQIDEKSN